MVVEEIVNLIKKDIVEGNIKSGERLPSVVELQQSLRVGRNSVREAFKILEGMNLISIKKGRGGGAFLTPNAGPTAAESLAHLFNIEESNLLDFINFRQIFEPKMVFSAALHRTEDDLLRLAESIEAAEKSSRIREFFISTTRTFFEAIAQATHNNYIVAFYHQVIPALTSLMKQAFEVPRCVNLSLHFHTQIYECIKAGDAEKGEMLSEAYLVQMENRIKNAKIVASPAVAKNHTVTWGTILTLSGTLADYGKQVAMGMLDAVRYLNENGGINGKNMELIVEDDKYNEREGVRVYQQLKSVEKVAGIHMQSTGTAQYLAATSTMDRVFMFTSAFTAKLTNPAKYPYNFSLGPTYSDMARIVIKYIRDTWTEESRNPKLIFMYPDNSYGRDHLVAAKMYAHELGVDVGPDQIVNWPTIDAVPELNLAMAYEPDFVFITSSAMNGSTILKDAKRLNLNTRFIGNIRVLTENLPRLAIEAVEGVIGVQPFAPFGSDVPGMELIADLHKKWHPEHQATLAYLEGWMNIVVPGEACRIADDAGRLNADGLRDAMESFRDYDSGGVLPLLSYFKDDHRATTSARIVRIENGQLVPITDYIDVGRESRFFEI